MNKFLDDLKYNVHSVAHKAKKGLLVGGLSLMAATSFVGCSKSSSDNTTTIEQEQNANELEKQFNDLSSKADNLATELETYSNYELSKEDSLKVSNFLLDYALTKTSQDYGGNIPTDAIIPTKNNSSLDGTFSVSEEEKSQNLSIAQYTDFSLNPEAVALYNNFIVDETNVRNALSSVYSVKADLIEKNPELLNDLSQEDMLNLIKSSYVAAYNNKNQNSDPLKAINVELEIQSISMSHYDITSYDNSENNYPSTLEHVIAIDHHSDVAKHVDNFEYENSVLTDYQDACIELSTSKSSTLDELKEANEKNEVTSKEIFDQLIDINREKAREEQENQTEQHSSEANEIDR